MMTRRLTALVVLALLGVGCGQPEEPEATAAIIAQCAGDADCGDGMMCHEGYAICVTADSPAQEVALVAAPPEGAQYVAAHQAGVTVSSANPDVDVVLPRTIRVHGQIRVTGNALEAGIKAQVLAVAKEQVIPGEYLTSQADAADSYELLLQADTPYTLKVQVQDQDWPLHVAEIDFSEDTMHTIWLPSPDDYPVLAGRVTRQLDGSMAEPLRDVKVTATSSQTGRPCTSAITDKLGTYTLLCPEPGSYQIRVSPTAEGAAIPTFTAKVDGKDTVRVLEDVTNISDIVVGEQSREQCVEFEVYDGDGEPAPLVSVSVVAMLSEQAGIAAQWSDVSAGAVLSRRGTTGDDGKLTLCVVEGRYTLTVAPHSTSPWAVQVIENWEALSPMRVDLTAKPTLSGTVVGWDGKPVAGATVTAWTNIVDPATGTSSKRQYVTTTATDGTWAAPVDAGALKVSVEPPLALAQPRWEDAQVVIPPEGATLDVTLARPALMEGLVLTPNGDDVIPGSQVVVYSSAEDGASPRLLGRGAAGADGRYLVILPAP